MKNTWLIVIIAAVVIGGIIWFMNNSSDNVVYQGTSSPYATASPTAKKTGPGSGPGSTATVSPTQKTYDQLVQQYKDQRIQFDSACRATPSSMALKTGSGILLDNRSNQAQTITVDGISYNLVAYGYQVVTVSSASLPRVIGINCGSSVNVSSINLQANISGQ